MTILPPDKCVLPGYTFSDLGNQAHSELNSGHSPAHHGATCQPLSDPCGIPVPRAWRHSEPEGREPSEVWVRLPPRTPSLQENATAPSAETLEMYGTCVNILLT